MSENIDSPEKKETVSLGRTGPLLAVTKADGDCADSPIDDDDILESAVLVSVSTTSLGTTTDVEVKVNGRLVCKAGLSVIRD